MARLPPVYLALAIVLLGACSGPRDDSLKYLGQEPPSGRPEIFAPGLISLENEHEYGSIFSRDGTELFYGVDLGGRSEIRHTRLEDGAWSEPRAVFVDDVLSFNDPFLSADERRLYFMSNRPLAGAGGTKDHDLWYATREESGWSEPVNLGSVINSTSDEYYISFTDDGTVYFASNVSAEDERRRNFDIYAARKKDFGFEKPRRLADTVNSRWYEADVFVAPDESYLIFCAVRREGLGQGDLYISFKGEDGAWREAVHMGEEINSERHELCPFVTRDGKYLFYTSHGEIYWVDAKIIDRFR